jgi:hypothetical protein
MATLRTRDAFMRLVQFDIRRLGDLPRVRRLLGFWTVWLTRSHPAFPASPCSASAGGTLFHHYHFPALGPMITNTFLPRSRAPIEI